MDYIELTPTTAHSNNYGTEYIYVVVNCDKTIDVGDSLSLTYTYNLRDFILPPNPVPVPMSTTIDWSTIDTSQAGYYLLEGVGRDKFGIYELHFGIVITVGTPSGGPNTPEAYVPYVYDDEWLDQLESYTVVKEGLTKNSTIVYDNQRNPTSITDFQYKDDISSAAAILSWSGKELTSIYIPLDQGDSVTIGYRYNDQGYRTRKTITEDIDSQVTVETIRYELIDDKVIYETNGTYGILFTYDYDGTLISFNYDDDITDQTNGDEYFYIRNQMGDITHIANSNGNVVVHYIYDAYGNITKIDSTTGYDDVAHANPYRYRGYRYDTELGLYYLNSRYYNPEIARFINADDVFGNTHVPTSNNVYSYSLNNPIMLSDASGAWPKLSTIFATIAVAAAAGFGSGCAGASLASTVIAGASYLAEENTKTPTIDDLSKPNVKYHGDNPNVPPDEGFEWKGKGNWVNKDTGEWYHPDLNHGEPIGPHWDYGQKGTPGKWRKLCL